MELNITNRTNRIRRNSQTILTQAHTAASGRTPSARSTPGTDRLALSQQALDFLETQNRRMQALWQDRQSRQSEDEGQSEEEAQLKHLGEAMKGMNTCHKIAARIMAGDKVPPEDMQYLMTHDPEGYKLALAMRKPKADPKEHKSALDEEDRKEAQAGQESESASGAPESAQAGGGADV